MPLYNFKCSNEKCDNIVEKIQKYDDDPPNCDKCESETIRIIVNTSFVLKGKGWFNKGGY